MKCLQFFSTKKEKEKLLKKDNRSYFLASNINLKETIYWKFFVSKKLFLFVEFSKKTQDLYLQLYCMRHITIITRDFLESLIGFAQSIIKLRVDKITICISIEFYLSLFFWSTIKNVDNQIQNQIRLFPTPTHFFFWKSWSTSTEN